MRLATRLLLHGRTPPNMPRETAEIMVAFAPTSAAAAIAEAITRDSSSAEAGKFRDLGARPVAVLTHGRPVTDAELKRQGMSRQDGEASDRIWLDLQNDMASWSSRSTHRVLSDASHFIQLDRPDAVVAAVREVVDGARSEGAR